ncbi:MAG: sigma-70 family RNA polymerase sigma factor [Endomicrobiales bacterium]|nr:sigma-70 family RNA polymerase sigma factor [Endomicrobiales bacterium]
MKINSIEEFIPLVKAVARKYARYGVLFDDLVQEGMLGVIEAKERYHDSKKAKPTTYATYWIKKKIIDYIQKENSINVSDINEFENNLSYSDAASAEKEVCIPDELPETEKQILDLFINRRKTLSEIADFLDMRREKVRQLKNKAVRILRGKKLI